MDKLAPVKIRPYKKADDEAYVVSHWLNGLRYSNAFFDRIPHDIYFTNYSLIVNSILNRAKTRVLIACLIDDEDVILGFSVHDHKAFHWIYIKPAWRAAGIAQALLPNPMPKYTSHITDRLIFHPKTHKLRKRLPLGLLFHPFHL